ncbi:hypothetical protein ACH4VX_19135 [Streptomyces sp. NPDC020731]|uniref:effector-associated domain 2-containing protein n=1 Tax=Streptomyces sp. NPDC020731 TaxID=3365085 RepID=UPI0037AF3C63
MFRLTEALCGLSCLEDQAGRTYFAGMPAEELNQHVDLRGTELREDVVALVRAALSVPAGERVLVDVVRVFEGAVAATVFEELLGPARRTPNHCPVPSTTRTWTPPRHSCAPCRVFFPQARCATCRRATCTSACRPVSHRSGSSPTSRS